MDNRSRGNERKRAGGNDYQSYLTHLAKPTFLAAFADGKTREIDAKKNGAILVGLFSPAGGEAIPDEY